MRAVRAAAPQPTMTATPDPRPTAAELARAAQQAEQDLQRVQGKVAATRALLVRLLQEVVVAERHLGRQPAPQLVEANEQLLLSALQYQDAAEAAALALQSASRSAGLDPLTQLPNRVMLFDRMTHALAGAKRNGSRLALLFLDLDRFKPLNDELGHALGDEVLKVVAGRLSQAVREVDTVSRYGGDEFVILLTEVSLPADVEAVAQKLVDAIAAPCRVGERDLALTASIGISLYPDDSGDIESLIGLADAAMYRAKRHGPGAYAFHGSERIVGGGAMSAPGPAAVLQRQRPPAVPPRRLASRAEQERRNAELREANEQLVLAAIGAQELQAAAQRARLHQAECLALVAKEVSDPQAPIRLASAMLGRTRDDERLLPRLQSIIEQHAQYMSRLVGEVQDLGHAEAGELRLSREPLELVDLLQTVVVAMGEQMETRRQHFEATWPTSPVMLLGDRARLAQIAGNLLDNASKYTPDGGEIRLTLEATADSAVLSVSDNGIGITAQALAEIFNPFVQDDLALGFNGIGRGIGLTVVRSLVEAHGGKVTRLQRRCRAGQPLRRQLAARYLTASAGWPTRCHPHDAMRGNR